MKLLILIIFTLLSIQINAFINKVHKKLRKQRKNPLGQLKEDNGETIQLLGIGQDGKIKSNEILIKEMNKPIVDECEYSQKVEYPLCLKLDCNLCQRTQKCGWCQISNKCIPTACDTDCINLQGFTQFVNHCPNPTKQVTNGSISNFNEEATKMIHPEMAIAKLKVRTTRTKYYSLSKQHKMGTQQSSETIQIHNGKEKENPDFFYKKSDSNPFYQSTSIHIPVSQQVDSKYYYQNSGNQIEKDNEQDIQTHGIDGSNQKEQNNNLQLQQNQKDIHYQFHLDNVYPQYKKK